VVCVMQLQCVCILTVVQIAQKDTRLEELDNQIRFQEDEIQYWRIKVQQEVGIKC
jgi:hypothetical protein